MSLGVTIVKAFPKNVQYRWRVVDLTMDTDYPANGYPLVAADFKLNGIIAVIPLGQEDGYLPMWDRSAGKLKVMMGDNNNASDGPAVECDTGRDDLTNKIITCLVVGY
jgi:hypothetical protein